MRLERLILRDFRNYSELDLNISPGHVVLVGDNGQGKTNLIEAIHLLFRGESFRAGSAKTFVRQTAEAQPMRGALVKARLEKDGLTHTLQWSFHEDRQKLEWNGKKSAGSRLASEFPLVLFSPESLSAIKEGPELRRRLIDDVCLTQSRAAGQVLKEFQKALRTRNRILKDYKTGKTQISQTNRLLESLDPIYLTLGAELAWERIQVLQGLKPDLAIALQRVLASGEPVEAEYLMSGQKVNDWKRPEILDSMHQRSLTLRPQELEYGSTLVGPHRHDIRFLFAGKDSRYFCSQGQQRALILSYKMAQIMYHHRTYQVFPFLFLDDVLSELDPDRRSNLMRFMKEIPSQIFLTTTDLSFSLNFGAQSFGDQSLSVLRIENGVITGARNTESLRRNIDSSP